jgi:hypothetical protein
MINGRYFWHHALYDLNQFAGWALWFGPTGLGWFFLRQENSTEWHVYKADATNLFGIRFWTSPTLMKAVRYCRYVATGKDKERF